MPLLTAIQIHAIEAGLRFDAFIVGIVVLAVVCRWAYDHFAGERIDRALAGPGTVETDLEFEPLPEWDPNRYAVHIDADTWAVD